MGAANQRLEFGVPLVDRRKWGAYESILHFCWSKLFVSSGY
jgi:hypothetical protein